MAQAPRTHRALAVFVALSLVALACVVEFLRLHGYSLLLAESMMLILACLVVGATLAVGAKFGPRVAEILILATALIFYAFRREEFTGPIAEAAGFVAGNSFTLFAGVMMGGFALLACAVVAVCLLLREHLPTVVVATFGTLLVATLVLPVGADGKPVQSGTLPEKLRDDLPPVVHVILDEHIGLTGLPPDMTATKQAGEMIRNVYRDFELHSHAYSRFADTKWALSVLFSLSESALDKGDDFYAYRLRRNEWIRGLKAKGYAVRVYQSNWIDLCDVADTCFAYSASLNAVQRSSLSVWARLRVLLRGIGAIGDDRGAAPLMASEALDRVLVDLDEHPRGVAYVVHLILPHFEYMFEEDCAIADPRKWRNVGNRKSQVWNSPAERVERYAAYLPQLMCTARRMDDLFERLRNLGVYDEATIIVHGDHGARIAEHRYHDVPANKLSNRDLLDHFSTLLAVKAPHIEAGIRSEPVSIQDYFASTFLDIDGEPARDSTIYIREPDGEIRPRRIQWPQQ